MRGSIQKRVAGQAKDNRGCAVLGCGRLTAASEGTGLHAAYCRAHAEHFRRHGSYSKPSYTAAQLEPHRGRALAWLRQHRSSAAVCQAVERVTTLYQRAGSRPSVFSLTGLEPEDRAMAAWARIREAQVDPLVILSAWLAVQACHDEDPQPEYSKEYRQVQAGKLLHRMAGGAHKSWGGYGGAPKIELHKYPASRGRVLRHLGRHLEQAASSLPAPVLVS